MEGRSYITLSQLQGRIRQVLAGSFATPVWITAEIGELKVNQRSGHCYMQLVEKGGRNGVPQAQAQAVVWAGQWGMLSSLFEASTGRAPGAGMNVLLCVQVGYHELYGLSLRVVDIDPLYTMGDMLRQRMETIARLREDGVFDLNRTLAMPEVIQRVAVVSSPTAAGYRDFMKELSAAPYAIRAELFEALMQGHGAESSIISALERIADRAEEFDAVAVIRGGGSQSDLSFLDSYLISYHIAQFPLPVIAGLGHDKDRSVVDLVAAVSLKTPTAVAAWIVDRAEEFEGRVVRAAGEVGAAAVRILGQRKRGLEACGVLIGERANGAVARLRWRTESCSERLRGASARVLDLRRCALDDAERRLRESPERALAGLRGRLEQAGRLVAAMDPANVLARGYAVVRLGGRALRSPDEVSCGDVVEVTLRDGMMKAKVTDNGK